MRGVLASIACLAALQLAACQPAALSCAPPGMPGTRVDFYFGMAIPGGGQVTETEWRSFLAEVMTPTFPDGLTAVGTDGQWRDTASGDVVREPGKHVLVFAFADETLERKVAAVAEAYRDRFQQQAVLTSSEPSCIAFR